MMAPGEQCGQMREGGQERALLVCVDLLSLFREMDCWGRSTDLTRHFRSTHSTSVRSNQTSQLLCCCSVNCDRRGGEIRPSSPKDRAHGGAIGRRKERLDRPLRLLVGCRGCGTRVRAVVICIRRGQRRRAAALRPSLSSINSSSTTVGRHASEIIKGSSYRG